MKKYFPSHWSKYNLDSLSDINPRFNIKISDDTDVSFIPMKNVYELSGKLNLMEIRKLADVKKGYSFFKDEDVIFAKITPCMENGKIAIVKHLVNGIGFGSTEFHVIRCNKNLLNKYLFYFLTQSSFRRLAKARMTGTAGQLRVPKKFIQNSEIPLPPLEEQHKIVAKIEELFSELDNGVELLKKAKEQLKTYRQAVLKYAFEGKLTEEFREKNKHLLWEQEVNTKGSTPDEFKDKELPVGWKWVKIRDCGNIVGGGTPSTKISEYFDGNISWITPADLSHYSEKYISKGKRNISALGLSKSSAKLLPEGSILFSSRAPIGYVAIASNDICTNQGFKSIIPKKSFSSEYLYYYLLGSKRLAENFASGTTFKEISLRNFSIMPVPIAPTKEQAQVVSEIEIRFSEADNLEKSINQSLEKAESLRQSILKQAFEGKLVKPVSNKINNFETIQMLARVIQNLEQNKLYQGEMIIAKFLYLVIKLNGIQTNLKFKPWHFGPYSPNIKKLLHSRSGYFIHKGNKDKGYYTLSKREQIFKYAKPSFGLIDASFQELMKIFSKYKDNKTRNDKIELLATVCKVIEDTHYSEPEKVYSSMGQWKTDKEITGFNNKAEKFNLIETTKCLALIKEKGWDRNLISK